MSRRPVRTTLTPEEAALRGMSLAVAAREHPDRLAIASPVGDRSFDQLNARANQLARGLRARGLSAGDSVALLCASRPEYAVAVQAALRSGLQLTPINWHLSADEVVEIAADCRAAALLADARFAQVARRAGREVPSVRARIAIGDPIAGFEAFDGVLEPERTDDLGNPTLGSQLFYTSGITGRPKGVLRPTVAALRGRGALALGDVFDYEPSRDLHLCTGPLHHPAPLAVSLMMPLAAGCGVVMMERFDARHALELISGYGVTHVHMAPAMFHQLLALPQDERLAFDVSSLRSVVHGAAPCPPEVKRGMIDWLGPILIEYYAGAEGWGAMASSQEWLERPGTVGRAEPGWVEVRDEQGAPLPVGREGVVYLRASRGDGFEYTSGAAVAEGDWFTLGDIGVLDEDGFLFLRGRSEDVIRSTGRDVYPSEVDACLLAHPAVADAATVGIPDPERGEEIVAVVAAREGTLGDDVLRSALMQHCRARLPAFKCPTRVVFSDSIPRRESGKLPRRALRDLEAGASAPGA